jgi:trehalose-6-phosphate synthase
VINEENGAEVVEVIAVAGMDLAMRYAYHAVAHTLMVMSIRDGLCLEPFDYITVQKDRPGNMIVSEFAGISRELSSVKRVNPFDITDVCNKLDQVLLEERRAISEKQEVDREFIANNTAEKYARHFLSDLKRSKKDTTNFQYIPIGFSDKVKLLGLRKNFKKLDTGNFNKEY